MQYVVKECSEFPSMGSELVTTDLDNAIHEFQVYLKRSGAMIPSFGFINKDGEHCDFFFGKCPEIDFDNFSYYYDLNEIDRYLVDAKRISIKISDSLGMKMFYDSTDIQNMILACQKNDNLKSSVLDNILSPSDKAAVFSVLKDGWYENFYKYDSDVSEKFITAIEKTLASENMEQQCRIRRSGR